MNNTKHKILNPKQIENRNVPVFKTFEIVWNLGINN